MGIDIDQMKIEIENLRNIADSLQRQVDRAEQGVPLHCLWTPYGQSRIGYHYKGEWRAYTPTDVCKMLSRQGVHLKSHIVNGTPYKDWYTGELVV